VLETSTHRLLHPPEDIQSEYLKPGAGRSFCEWKGEARYYTLEVNGRRAENVGWYYPNPTPSFAPIRDHVAFYAAPLDGCFVDGERVTPQPGGFYGGWITSDVVGPFKAAGDDGVVSGLHRARSASPPLAGRLAGVLAPMRPTRP
jgi:hypothetical protein